MKKIDSLEPEFKMRIEQLLKDVQESTGLKWIVTSGRRTMKEQQDLYDMGRTAPGKVVTNARPGSSPHNFGLAADLCPLHPETGECWWDAPKMKWRIMADCASSLGMVAGFFFKTIYDAPHVEAKDWRVVQAKWRDGEIEVA